MKKIAFLIVDEGCDGMAKATIAHAFWDEQERDNFYNTSPSKQYHRTAECIVDIDKDTQLARNKLNALEKLLIGIN